jgi:serine/threonine protein kinase
MSTPNVGQSGRFVPRVGAVVAGKYRIERKLGEGGMGLVVAATHLTLGGQVALKFLTMGDEIRPEALARFTREAQTVARIKSEHIARVLDMGTVESGAPYIVMELLEGQDLHKFVRKNGPLPSGDAVEFILQAAEGVAEAHAAGIVHRDLKPANLFLSHKPDGSPFVRVLDFGIAKDVQAKKEAGDVSLTVGTDVLGSPLYMAPEQIRNPKDVDPRADVWSLGAILYKLLTGRSAFEADNPSATLAMIVMEEPDPIRMLRPDVPAQLEAVVQRCLEKKIDQRFQSVDELACALLPFAPSRPRGRPWVPKTVLVSTTTNPFTTTGNALPIVHEAGSSSLQTTQSGQSIHRTQSGSSPRSTSIIAVAFGAIAGVGLIIFVIVVLRAANRQDMARVAASAVPAPASPASQVIAEKALPAQPVEKSTGVIVPIATSSVQTAPLTSASAMTTKPLQPPTRNNALDDRL